MHAGREVSPPGARVVTRDGFLRSTVEQRFAVAREPLAQQPRRLHRHADSLAENRVRLARRVADRETGALAPSRADAGPQRPDREPRSFAPRAGERDAHTSAARCKGRLDRIAGARGRRRGAPLAQCVAADAAGERQYPAVGDDHAAVAAAERQHGQYAGLEARSAEVCLERDEVARTRTLRALAP